MCTASIVQPVEDLLLLGQPNEAAKAGHALVVKLLSSHAPVHGSLLSRAWLAYLQALMHARWDNCRTASL